MVDYAYVDGCITNLLTEWLFVALIPLVCTYSLLGGGD